MKRSTMLISLGMLGFIALVCGGCPPKKQVVKTTVMTDYSMISVDVNGPRASEQAKKEATPEIVKQLTAAVRKASESVTPVPEKGVRPGDVVRVEDRGGTPKGYVNGEDALANSFIYRVKKKDCLWNISRKQSVYGTGFQWPLIYRENRDQIKDPERIEIGQELVIVKHPADQQVSDAVKFAQRYKE